MQEVLAQIKQTRRRIATNPEPWFCGAQEAPAKHPSFGRGWPSGVKPLRTCPMCCSKSAARPQRPIRTVKADFGKIVAA